MNELTRFFGDTGETRLYRLGNNFIIELYRDNKLIESRTVPSEDRTFRELFTYAEDYAEDWANGDMQ